MLRPLGDVGGFHQEVWQEILRPYLSSNWLDTPWLITEFYFYRRVVEAFDYFQAGPSCAS